MQILSMYLCGNEYRGFMERLYILMYNVISGIGIIRCVVSVSHKLNEI